MDGAMKFVKGDAIAGMLIAFVNIVAGVAIGVGMRGMSLGESVDTYSILSIGDGMVAQIPSLFVSIAAGIVLTRVGGRSGGRNHLGVQIAQEVLGHPAALLIAAVIVAGFLLVPGLPAWPFLLLALVLASAGYLARRAGTAADAAGDRSDTPAMLPDRAASAAAEGGATATTAIAVPLRLRVAPGLSAGLSLSAFDAALEREKATLGRELGLPFPGLKLSVDDTLSGRQYAIDVQEVPVSQGDLQNGNVLAFAVREAGTSATADGMAPSQSKGAHSDNGSARPSTADTLAAHVAWVVRRYADSFIGMQETHELLTRAATQLPDLAAEVQKAVPLQRIADVLRRLVQEGVSIRYLREIFESLVVWSARENDIVMLTEYVRVDLGRFIVPRYVDGKNQLRAIVLDAEAEKALRESIQQSPSGSFLALAPEKAQALTAGAESALSRVGSSDGGAVVLAPMDVRRYLKKFLSSRFPNWAVLSFQELPPNVQLRAVGRLGLQAVTPRRSASNRL
jgi:type III secretion protein V